MSLLNVTVKKARYVGAQAAQFNTYVTLKLQNVKSTTVTVKGANPCWEQDFLFETNDLNTGLLIEVWSKGMIWDRAMGYHWIPLESVQYANEGHPGLATSNSMPYTDEESYDGSGQWLSLEAELVMRDGEVVGTKNPTGHSLLVDCRFELPFGRCDPPMGWQCILRETDISSASSSYVVSGPYSGLFGPLDPENTEAADLQRKLEMLNNIMDQEARAEQARRQMQYFGHSGYSEDSDYTSDLNYPVGQHANSSASQFRSAAGQMHTPQRSLETSRENSYERDDVPNNHHLHHLPAVTQHRLSPGHAYHARHYAAASAGSPNHLQRYSPNAEDFGYNTSENAQNSSHQFNDTADSEPLYYNSRPRNNYKQRYSSQDTWYSAEYGQQSIDSVDAALGKSTFPTDMGYGYGNSQVPTRRNRGGTARRPSLERQTTLYDDQYYNAENSSYYPSIEITDTREKSFNQSYEEYFDTSSYPYQEERYGQDEEDRQWDSGGLFYHNKTNPPAVYENHVTKRRKSLLPPTPQTPSVVKSTSYSHQKKPYEDETYPTAPTPSTTRRRMPQIPSRRSASRQGSLNDYDNDSCRTPENSSHRGASLPPTPTTTPKLLARLATHTKPSVSLPPTPGRQLPKPNLNHRSAKARRNNLMKRTSSADYADIEQEDAYNSYYIRPGAMSATQMYNEDYNYAYQSIDNLPAQPDTEPSNSLLTQQDNTSSFYPDTTLPQPQQPQQQQQQQQQLCSVVVTSERRTSLTGLTNLAGLGPDISMTVNNQNDSSLLGYQQPSTDDYYYSAQEDRDYQDEYDYEQQEAEAQAAAARKKRLARRENSPLLQQNTDSLESRDDELKDSFETAVSSISSSLQHQRRGGGGYSEYSTAGDTLSTSTTSAMALPVDSPQKNISTTTVTASQYNRDQFEPPKAIVSVNGGASVRDNMDNTNANTNATANASSVMNNMASIFSAGFSAAASAVAAVTNNARNLANNNQATNQASKPMTGMTANSGFVNNNLANDRTATRGYLKQQDSMDHHGYLQQQQSIDHGYLQQQDSLDRGYLKQQDSLDRDYYRQESLDHSEYYDEHAESAIMNDNYIKTDAIDNHYLNQQESIESYTEESGLANGSLADEYNGKVGKESPVSVIHVEPYDPEAAEKDDSLSELQSQHNILDPYHPNNRQMGQLDPYAPPASVRRASIDPYRPMSPTRRTSGEYTMPGSRKSSIVDQYSNSVARKSSLDPYQPSLSRRASVKYSPTPSEMHKQESVDQMSPTGSIIMDEHDEKKVSFEEEEEMKQPRMEVTAKQRWHWAYNKIIIQLNVKKGGSQCVMEIIIWVIISV